MTHRDLFLRPSCCQFVQFISRSFGGDEFNVCVSPAPPVLFCYPALITTPTADPAVICTSPTKAAAVRGLDGQCFMNSGKANLSPYIAVKLCQTRLPPSLLRSSVPILYKVGGVVWCGTVNRSKCHTSNDAAMVKKSEATKHSFSTIRTLQNKTQQRIVTKFI